MTVAIAKNRWSRYLAPEAIIVGIKSRSNQERFSFAMPMLREDASIAFENSDPAKMSAFLDDELNTTISSDYRTNGFTMLIGMSPTATNVIYDYLAEKPFFDAHIAIAADLQFKTLSGKGLPEAIIERAKKHKHGFILASRAATDLVNDPSREQYFTKLNNLDNHAKLGVHGFLPTETEHYSVALQTIDYALGKLFPMTKWRPDYRALRNSENPTPYLKAFYENLEKEVGFETYPTVDGYWMGNSILGLARALGRNEKLPQAEDMLLWADSKLPENLWITYYLSRVNARMNKLDKAVKYAKIAIALATERQDENLPLFSDNLKNLTATKSD